MRKIAYLECPTGIAGDMVLGALIDAGIPLEVLQQQLSGLGIDSEYDLHAEKVRHHGQVATKVSVNLHSHPTLNEVSHSHPHSRHLPEIEQIIYSAGLNPCVTQWSLQVFHALAEAEASVHGIAPEKVHFHEVGATDAIIDIVGSCIGLDLLGIELLYCSPLPTGGGTVKAAHGLLPVPAPAVLKLWESHCVPIYSNGIMKELVTPTGAALACSLATGFGAPPAMTLQRVGLGAGSHSLPIPNMLRLWIGESVEEVDNNVETIALLETQIDDTTPQAIAYTMETLFTVGALDVFTQPITMKKSRLGTLLTVVCPLEKVSACEEVLFRETTTLGIRRLMQQRTILQREMQTVETSYGNVQIKVATLGQGENKKILNVQPEYEDCAQLARQHSQPWTKIHQIALESYYCQYAKS